MVRIARIRTLILTTAAGLALVVASAGAQTPVGSAFTYQGSLAQSGTPVTGSYDFQFMLYDAATGGTQMGGTISLPVVGVANGVFTELLDFGSSWFLGEARWLEVSVRAAGTSDPYTVFPRQRLTVAPFALALSLPHEQVYSSSNYLFQMRNTGTGGAASFSAVGSAANYAVLGKNSSTGFNAAGVRGEANANSGVVIGVEGAAPNSPSGTGLVGKGRATGAWIEGTGAGSTGLFARGYQNAIHAENLGTGPAIYATGNGQMRDNATVRIVNTQPSQGMCQYVTNNSTWANTHLQNDGSGQVLWLQQGGTGDYIVAYSGTEWKFWVDNAGVTHTKVLEILGGADLSEKFDVRDEEAAIEPGMVVSIDAQHEGRLAVSRQPYDHRVAGIISGAGGVKPGMLMGQQGSVADGAQPVALSGRVYCRATAANGAITPGDLLTTSAVPGHAMRVDDPARAQGAILGKAMSTLEEGEGLVLVLVGLQ